MSLSDDKLPMLCKALASGIGILQGGLIQALARAHTLLTDNSWQGTDLLVLVRDQLLLGDVDHKQINYSGPSVSLDAQTALHVALVLHELGTNARKYGSLSSASG